MENLANNSTMTKTPSMMKPVISKPGDAKMRDNGVSPTTGQPLKGPAATAIVKVSGDTGRGEQVELKKAISSIKPGNTVTYHGTQVQVTDGNQNSDQVKGMKNFMTKVDNGATRTEALSDTRTKFPGFQLAPIKVNPGKGSSGPSSAKGQSRQLSTAK